MKDLSAKKTLVINLNKKEYEIVSSFDLNKFVGGVGLGLKLLEQHHTEDPVVFSVGPLNGFFPFCTKTSVVLDNSGVIEDLYFGGGLSGRLRFTGFDSVVINGKSDNPVILSISEKGVSFYDTGTEMSSMILPGKSCILEIKETRLVLDTWFYTPEDFLFEKMKQKNIGGIVVTGGEVYKVKDFGRYENLYNTLLNRYTDITMHPSGNPSCSNCFLGCEKSKSGEIGGNVFIHSLVSCQYAERIYSDIGVVFSCLEVLGYDYTHEDLESLPSRIEETLKSLA